LEKILYYKINENLILFFRLLLLIYNQSS